MSHRILRLWPTNCCRAGASLVSLIAAFIYMNTRQRDYNLILAVSAEEEVSGCNGLGYGLLYKSEGLFVGIAIG